MPMLKFIGRGSCLNSKEGNKYGFNVVEVEEI